MIWLTLHRYFMVTAAAIVCGWLAFEYGVRTATTLWVVVSTIACLIGALLLRFSPLGRIGWQNRIASYLIPWGCRLTRGELWPIPAVSWLVWLMIGASVFGLKLWLREADSVGLTTRILLFMAWMIDGGALLFLLGTIRQYGTPRSSAAWRLGKLAALLAGLIIASAGLYFFFADPGLALLIAGGPPALIGAFYGLFALVILVLGRNARWN